MPGLATRLQWEWVKCAVKDKLGRFMSYGEECFYGLREYTDFVREVVQ